ncbi:hypothetical protein K458DRAFT_5274 [Lentithecium fluviatile CBS 122367]|uniref:Uncharacterized protein n=1 Tax=Lentithecium fluviatile CBS 122367 TaxID=1168545 RepID=A0A6G1JMG7_9PLEO|nr:hypothetical protein K458DRAFT_5274 [Lentithecium fluviatile CBS 122367]
MHPRFHAFSQAFRSSKTWAQGVGSASHPRIAQFICQSCRHKFSTSSIFRKIAQGSRRNLATAAKDTKDTKARKYPSELLIYDAGEARTTFIAFWKAVALLECGTCVVFFTPKLYKNENQPNEYIRTAQAVGVTLASALPSIILSYLTAPFVNQVYMKIPPHAQHSFAALKAFARNLPPTTRLRFLTLRIFPIGKFTTNFLFELRALPPSKLRFANIVMPKTDAWRQRQAQKSWGRKFWEFLMEPRFKFYVKEGRTYTIRSGVPGVWEEVAQRIKEQTVKEVNTVGAKGVRRLLPARPVRTIEEVTRQQVAPIKRQTSRAPMK